MEVQLVNTEDLAAYLERKAVKEAHAVIAVVPFKIVSEGGVWSCVHNYKVYSFDPASKPAFV